MLSMDFLARKTRLNCVITLSIRSSPSRIKSDDLFSTFKNRFEHTCSLDLAEGSETDLLIDGFFDELRGSNHGLFFANN